MACPESSPRARLNRLFSAFLAALAAGLLVLVALLAATGPQRLALLFAAPAAAVPLYLFGTRRYRRRARILARPFPDEWRRLLTTRIAFYRALSPEEKARFEREAQLFIGETRITGIQTSVDDECRLLVAASAVIPVFGFPGWEYDGIGEILVYPQPFDENYRMGGDRPIAGLVGGAHLRGVMILVKSQLEMGFASMTDGRNVGLHEFAHILDQADGWVDGVPAALGGPLAAWQRLLAAELERLRRRGRRRKRGELDAYGGTNAGEFFAVAVENFFEDPDRLAKKQPELYRLLRELFRQDPRSRFKDALRSVFRSRGRKLGRNSRCPCGSGKKYKRCCLK